MCHRVMQKNGEWGCGHTSPSLHLGGVARMMDYKAVFFDVGGVLVSPPQEAIKEYAEIVGVFP